MREDPPVTRSRACSSRIAADEFRTVSIDLSTCVLASALTKIPPSFDLGFIVVRFDLGLHVSSASCGGAMHSRPWGVRDPTGAGRPGGASLEVPPLEYEHVAVREALHGGGREVGAPNGHHCRLLAKEIAVC